MDIGTLMTRYGVPAVSSPDVSRVAPLMAFAPNRPVPRAALVLAAAAQLITLPGPVTADSVACPVMPAVGAIKGSGASGLRAEEGESR